MGALDEHLKQATIASAPRPEASDTWPRITEEVRKDNLRRLAYPVFVAEHLDGKRSFVHDPGIIRDGLIASTGTDRGHGSKASLTMLGEEGPQSVEGIGAPERERDDSGRFVSAMADTVDPEPAGEES